MMEMEGRFLSKAHSHTSGFTGDSFCINKIPVIRRDKTGNFVSIAQLFERFEKSGSTELESYRGRLDRVADLLNLGRTAEAIFLANMYEWTRLGAAVRVLCKAGFNEAEARDSHGQWAKANASNTPPLIDIQYRGKYHNEVVKDVVEGLRAQGSTVLENFPVKGLNTMTTIPDSAVKPPGSPPYFFEVKTGFDPKPTDPQDFVYPLICLGGHATSPDPRTTQLGLTPGAVFPPMDIWFIVKGGPKDTPIYFNYCDAIGIRRKFNGP